MTLHESLLRQRGTCGDVLARLAGGSGAVSNRATLPRVRRLGVAGLRSHSETVSVTRCGDARVPNGFELFNSVLLMIGHVFAY
jgi:hypothetical protein